MTVTYDPDLSDFDIEVYNWMARSIRETGEPMRQAMIANKMRCARATVRKALIELDRRGYLTFTRFRPQNTVLTIPDRRLTNVADTHVPPEDPPPRVPAPRAPEPARSPHQRSVRMPWDG